MLVEVPNKDLDTRLTPSLALYYAEGVSLAATRSTACSTSPLSTAIGSSASTTPLQGRRRLCHRLTVSTRPRSTLFTRPWARRGGQRPHPRRTQLPRTTFRTQDPGKALKRRRFVSSPSGDAHPTGTDHLELLGRHRRFDAGRIPARLNAVFIGAVRRTGNEADGPNDAPAKPKVRAYNRAAFPPPTRTGFLPPKDEAPMRVFSERLGRPTHAFLLLEQLKRRTTARKSPRQSGRPSTNPARGAYDLSTRDPHFVSPLCRRRAASSSTTSSTPPPTPQRPSPPSVRRPDSLAAYGIQPREQQLQPHFWKSLTVRKGEASAL